MRLANLDDVMTLAAKYPGRCATCGYPFAVGAPIDWDRTTRASRHAACVPEFAARATQQAQTVAASRATGADVEIPAPEGLAYLPFQRAGIVFCLDRFGKGGDASPSRGGAALIADEMG